MLTISGRPKRVCDGLTRRDILQAAGAGLLGLSLPKLLAAQEHSKLPAGRAKSVIFLFLFGGPSQLETFDMKPEAPEEIRGPFKEIDCRTSGMRMCEHLPKLAEISDKYTVIRTMTHNYNDHSGAGHYIQTGKRWHIPVGGGFSSTPQDWPSMGSVTQFLETQKSAHKLDLPAYAVVPNRLGRLQDAGQYRRPGEYAGWLGRAFNPLTTKIDKRDAKDNPYWRDCSDTELNFQIEGLTPPADLSQGRIRKRLSLLEKFDDNRLAYESRSKSEFDKFREQAIALVASDRTRQALDIRKESETLRDRYGRHLFGQSALMARRLVEAGVKFVTVHYDCVDGYSWDSHRNSEDVQKHLLPTFDQALSALLTDLQDRGMLDETMVVAVGEMGRTPKGNANWGRNHWSTLFPAVLAGGGVGGGVVYGTSDKDAAYPVDHPVSPEDLAATIYHALGVSNELILPDALGRPVPVIEGEPIKAVFS